MNKLAFVMSSILTMLGVMLFAWTEIAKAVIPMVLMQVITSFSSRYSTSIIDYMPDISGIRTVAVVIILAGAILSAVFYSLEKKK